MAGRQISRAEAIRQFDMLFDEFLKEDFNNVSIKACADTGERNLLEVGFSDVECDSAGSSDVQCDSAGNDQEKTIKETALLLREFGDGLNKQHFKQADIKLTDFIKKMPDLDYDTFQDAVGNLTTNDRNKADFVFVMCLCKNVSQNVGNLKYKVRIFFQRYIGNNYIDEIANVGGVNGFVEQ